MENAWEGNPRTKGTRQFLSAIHGASNVRKSQESPWLNRLSPNPFFCHQVRAPQTKPAPFHLSLLNKKTCDQFIRSAGMGTWKVCCEKHWSGFARDRLEKQLGVGKRSRERLNAILLASTLLPPLAKIVAEYAPPRQCCFIQLGSKNESKEEKENEKDNKAEASWVECHEFELDKWFQENTWALGLTIPRIGNSRVRRATRRCLTLAAGGVGVLKLVIPHMQFAVTCTIVKGDANLSQFSHIMPRCQYLDSVYGKVSWKTRKTQKDSSIKSINLWFDLSTLVRTCLP